MILILLIKYNGKTQRFYQNISIPRLELQHKNGLNLPKKDINPY